MPLSSGWSGVKVTSVDGRTTVSKGRATTTERNGDVERLFGRLVPGDVMGVCDWDDVVEIIADILIRRNKLPKFPSDDGASVNDARRRLLFSAATSGLSFMMAIRNASNATYSDSGWIMLQSIVFFHLPMRWYRYYNNLLKFRVTLVNYQANFVGTLHFLFTSNSFTTLYHFWRGRGITEIIRGERWKKQTPGTIIVVHN